jgi:betaine-aldehyde dehydrogenase
VQFDKVMSYIDSANKEGARLVTGGGPPSDPALAKGLYIEPTVFAGVKSSMRIFKEEIFGPVVGIIKWTDEAAMIDEVNSVEYGLTASIWSNDITTAHRAAMSIEAGFVWINDASKHFLGTPFGGYKQSGIGREECLEELISFTQEKNININLARPGNKSLASMR